MAFRCVNSSRLSYSLQFPVYYESSQKKYSVHRTKGGREAGLLLYTHIFLQLFNLGDAEEGFSRCD